VWVEMEAVLQGEVRVPLGGDKVYKDQCVYSFDTPVSNWCVLCPVFHVQSTQESAGGLYVCLYSFLGFGKDHVQAYCNKSGRRLFLHIKRTKKPPQPAEKTEETKKPTRLAIGVSLDCIS